MRHLLSIESLSRDEIFHIVDLACKFKADKKAGKERQYLKKKNIALLFEKDSTRTRCAFEIAAADQGAKIVYIGQNGSHYGKDESIKDTARVFGRMFDAMAYRGYGQGIVTAFADYSGIPVWNALTNESHPTQILADLMTIKECMDKPLEDIKICFLGNAKSNVAMSLMIGAVKTGMHFVAAAPCKYHPDSRTLLFIAEKYGADILYTEDVEEAVKDADFIYTDVWVSMGESQDLWEERIKEFSPYQVNDEVMRMTQNPDCKFMHCLPAFHDANTKVTREISDKFGLKELEVTNSVFESPRNIAFNQVENRMHVIKAIMLWSLAGK